MASRKVGFHPAARTEAAEALAWYEARSSIAASAFAMELELVVGRVADRPERWPLARDGTRRLVFPRFPFTLVYRVRDDEIEVVAVAHQRRRAGYWKAR